MFLSGGLERGFLTCVVRVIDLIKNEMVSYPYSLKHARCDHSACTMAAIRTIAVVGGLGQNDETLSSIEVH